MPSSGVCVLIWRWCFCACSLRNTWASSGVLISSHGAFSETFASTSGSPAISIAIMPCTHVVPDFGGAATTISPARAVKAPQRTYPQFCHHNGGWQVQGRLANWLSPRVHFNIQRFGNCENILITTATHIHADQMILWQCGRNFHHMSQRMGWLKGGNDAFQLTT